MTQSAPIEISYHIPCEQPSAWTIVITASPNSDEVKITTEYNDVSVSDAQAIITKPTLLKIITDLCAQDPA